MLSAGPPRRPVSADLRLGSGLLSVDGPSWRTQPGLVHGSLNVAVDELAFAHIKRRKKATATESYGRLLDR